VSDGRSPLFGFSTLGCPEWDAETVVNRAATFGYGGIEWRGGDAGTVRPTWASARRLALRRALERRHLRSIAITTYSNFITGDEWARKRSIDDVRDHLLLARDLGAASVRVFLGVRDDDVDDDVLAQRAIAGLTALLEAAHRLGVGLAIEPHDDHVRREAILAVLDALPDASIGVVWDIANAWAAGEEPDDGLGAYDGRIDYIQVKDGTGRGSSWRLCRLGAGDVPIARALEAVLWRSRERGEEPPPVSVEWEKAWHPELESAEIALPAALDWLVEHAREPASTDPDVEPAAC
jgi:sugar phosphate isomerase/epimerase